MASDRHRIETHLLADEIVVGISADLADVDPDDFDVLLTDAPDPPAPWVHDSMERIAAAVAAAPMPAVTLVQVLRATGSLGVAAGIAAESTAYSMLQHGSCFRAWLATRPDRRGHEASPDPVQLSRSGGGLDVVLNRPTVHNAFDAAMRDALCEAFDLVALDPDIGEVHLRGNGPSFCSGGDLDEFGTATDAAVAHRIRTTRSVGRRVHQCADRVTAHLHGSCIGAGIEIPAFAGHVVADPATTFRLPEVGFGLIPGAGGTVGVPRRIGRHRTAWLALTGVPIGAETAVAWGLVDAVAGVDGGP